MEFAGPVIAQGDDIDAPVTPDRAKEEREKKMEIAKSFRRAGVTIETIAKAFGVHENTVKTWTKGWDSEVSQEARESGS